MIRIAPSILSADFTKIKQEINSIKTADLIHCDVMDGCFVPNISFGPKMVKDIRKITGMLLDAHLMIINPQNFIPQFIDAGADYITIHLEACGSKTQECLEMVKKAGIKSGLAISPDTPVNALRPYIKDCDLLLLMSVYPGFSGQKFIESSINKAVELKTLRDELNPKAVIEIDGGITIENIRAVKDAGVQIAVAGNTVFKAQNRKEAIETLKKVCSSAEKGKI